MQAVIDTLTENAEVLTFGILSSILATIVVLITRLIFLKIVSTFPSNRLFHIRAYCKLKSLIKKY